MTHRTNFKEVRLHFNKKQRQREDAAEYRRVCQLVDQRDGRSHCRCCGRRVSLGGGLEHNHLRERSLASRAIKNTVQNLFATCGDCNRLLKLKKIQIIGTNAEKPLAFRWTTLATWLERRFGDARRLAPVRLRDERGDRFTERKQGHMEETNQSSTPADEPTPTPQEAAPQEATDQGDGAGQQASDDAAPV